jgi:hypothetical protein
VSANGKKFRKPKFTRYAAAERCKKEAEIRGRTFASAFTADCFEVFDQIADRIVGKQHLVGAPDDARRFQLRGRTFEDHKQLAVRIRSSLRLSIFSPGVVD